MVGRIGCVIVGRKTFEQYYGEIYPLKNVLNIVVTTRPSTEKKSKDVVFVSSPREALQVAKRRNYNEVLLVGGGHINGSFLAENLIDEIFLSIHPLILGSGIKLFEDCKKQVDLKSIGLKTIDHELVQLHYKVVKQNNIRLSTDQY